MYNIPFNANGPDYNRVPYKKSLRQRRQLIAAKVAIRTTDARMAWRRTRHEVAVRLYILDIKAWRMGIHEAIADLDITGLIVHLKPDNLLQKPRLVLHKWKVKRFMREVTRPKRRPQGSKQGARPTLKQG